MIDAQVGLFQTEAFAGHRGRSRLQKRFCKDAPGGDGMETSKMRLFPWSFAFFFGVFLALASQTKYRFLGPVGIGEIGLALIVPASFLIKTGVRESQSLHRWGVFAILYIFCVLVPVSLIHAASPNSAVYNIELSNRFREIVSLLLGVLVFLWSIKFYNYRFVSAQAFVVTVIVLIILQYRFGGDAAWFGTIRFSGGANNPNQIAIYILVASILTFWCFRPIVAVPLLILLGYFGYATMSDALIAAAILTTVIVVALVFVPRRHTFLAFNLLFVGGVVFLGLNFEKYAARLTESWAEADIGNSRFALYSNGISAWLDTPFDFFLGHGVGSLSGMIGPFYGMESHNTFIEILCVGGILGFLIVVRLFLEVMVTSLRTLQLFPIATFTGLAVFAFFHVVFRTPCYWFCIATTAVRVLEYSATDGVSRIKTRLPVLIPWSLGTGNKNVIRFFQRIMV
jgi:hypothetical protein